MTRDEHAGRIAATLAADLGLGTHVWRFPTGSVPVFRIGDRHVLKMFPSSERRFFETEVAALERIDGGLSVPTPRLISTGEREAWWYVAMTRLSGRTLSEVWRQVGAKDRLRLMHAVGAALAELHDLPIDGLRPLEVDWSGFIEAQRASCTERQQAKGLGEPWLDQIADFVDRHRPEDRGDRVLLHTEVMREHLLTEETERGWRLSGLVDFEPAMVGAPGYELASVGVFVACGEPKMLRAVLDAYGAPYDDSLPLEIMAYALLHRYSNLRWYLERLSAPQGAQTIEDLARAWFTLG